MAHDDDDAKRRVAHGALAVFPLPNTVLFPEQRLPLHIFEPRFRQMVRDALEDAGGYIVIARIEPPVTEPSRFARVATAGRIVSHQRLADGRFNILVEGAVRVALDEETTDKLYRCVRCTPLSEPSGAIAEVPPTDRAAMLSLVSLVVRAARLRSPGVAFDPPADLDAARLAWRIADKLVADPERRQAILEADTARVRVSLTTDALADALGEISPAGPHGGARAN